MIQRTRSTRTTISPASEHGAPRRRGALATTGLAALAAMSLLAACGDDDGTDIGDIDDVDVTTGVGELPDDSMTDDSMTDDSMMTESTMPNGSTTGISPGDTPTPGSAPDDGTGGTGTLAP